MEKSDEILIERHIRDDAELERYVEEHRQFEEDLEAFNRRIYLTPEEEVKKGPAEKETSGEGKDFFPPGEVSSDLNVSVALQEAM